MALTEPSGGANVEDPAQHGRTHYCQACFEIALDWTKNREIAGRPVRNRSLHASVLGEMIQKIALDLPMFLKGFTVPFFLEVVY